ncbi:pyridoxine 5'-phosphate synthase [Desulfotalea psychrophila]|uniref:Multifunctional fusion protein n=1 Tax=Desulfotalea psychrophila (strain LSv54 / DSM 12343) TaxID=177439 RepID=Q3V7H8_DESPS|nr:pyridoxine 5'-phosphate synthase [Desulfotalea psychrophila]CAG36334.1 probable pyridoxal phosphate biosynthetic protein [Desulfotalea psychrophila LSv54]
MAVELQCKEISLPIPQKEAKHFAHWVLTKLGVNDHNLNIVFVSDAQMTWFNEHYREKKGPTNVLSFPFAEGSEEFLQQIPVHELGDIIISVDTAMREAIEYGQTISHRLNWLMVHGILHLVGYDHERGPEDALLMEDKEQVLLKEYAINRRFKMTQLAINIDHVATIRQARGITEPDPVAAAAICEMAGAAGIVVHLREDRRHMQDRDIILLRQTIKTKMNFEMGANKEIIKIALNTRPDMITLVPEKRQELTTEGGLDVAGQKKKLARTIERMTAKNIPVSLFIDPVEEQIEAAYEIGAQFVELHTGKYSDAIGEAAQEKEYQLLVVAAQEAAQRGLRVNAGHGLGYHNAARIAAIDAVEELSIGHSIIGRAVFSGLDLAVRDMLKIVQMAG